MVAFLNTRHSGNQDHFGRELQNLLLVQVTHAHFMLKIRFMANPFFYKINKYINVVYLSTLQSVIKD